MPSSVAKWRHNSETNWLPRSDVMTDGVPKRAIHPWRRASASVSVDVSTTGNTSSQCENWSTTVRRCVDPSEDSRGLMTSTWMCSKRRCTGGKVERGALMCRCIFDAWQRAHAHAHRVTSTPIFGHTNLLVTSFFVALTPGCARL